MPACSGSNQIDRPTNVSYALMSNMVRMVDYAYTPRLGAPEPGVHELPGLSMCYTPSWLVTRTEEGGGVLRTYGRLRLHIHSRFRLNPGAAWQNSRTAAYTWSAEQVIETHCTQFQCHWEKTPQEGLTEVWPRDRTLFANNATITNNTALDSSLSPTLRTFLQTRIRSMYDRVQGEIGRLTSPVYAAVKKMNTAARLLQAYTRLGMPLALESDDVLSANLFGQYQIPVNMPTDPKIANAYGTASDNYLCGTGPCSLDPSRPLRNQVSLKVPCEASGSAASLPGDPLGDCLIASAWSRALRVMRQYIDWAQAVTVGAHREQVPWVSDTLAGLRITTRLTHPG